MVYPAVFFAERRGGGVRARRKAAPARSRQKCWPISLRQRFDSRSFAHVFQLYGSSSYAQCAYYFALVSRRAQTPRCLLVSLLHASELARLNVNTRLVGKPGSWYSTDTLHRSQKCLLRTNLIRWSRCRSKISTANPPTWINRSRADAHSCKNAAPPLAGRLSTASWPCSA